jgi:hypothetical protein
MSELIYPDAPGFKVAGPSERAAEAISGTANKMRAAVLAQFAQYPGGATADEVARDLNLSILSVRPRVSELKRTGKIKADPRAPQKRKRNDCDGLADRAAGLALDRGKGRVMARKLQDSPRP